MIGAWSFELVTLVNPRGWCLSAGRRRSHGFLEGTEITMRSHRTSHWYACLAALAACGPQQAQPTTPAIGEAAPAPAPAQAQGESTAPPPSGPAFNGKIALDIRNSTPDWAPYTPKKAPEGSPNVLFV